MRRFRARWRFVPFVFLFLLIVFVITGEHSFTTRAACIKPFHEFAYLPDDTARPIPKILPPHPWQVEATLPGAENTTYGVPDIQIELARTVNGEEEIWLFKRPVDSGVRAGNGEGSFLIYRPQSQTWAEISALIGRINLSVRELFVGSDGTVWGQIAVEQSDSVPTTGPVLAKYNESRQRFDPAPGGLEISLALNGGYLSQPLHIVLDEDDIFWIFGPDNAIYRYDPRIQSIERRADIPYMARMSTAVALDGSIYFQDQSLAKGEAFLFRFIPETGEVVALDVSREPWEMAGGMLLDQKGRLWLGAMGYMDQDGRWHLLHPDVQKAWENRSEFLYWSPPVLIFESSNGWLWYAEYHDMERIGEGTAWYDPAADQGCLFTNIASYIVEDEKKQLWMVADEKLYRYALGSDDP